MEPVDTVLEMALEAGFDLAGIAPLRPPQDAERFRDWLSRGRHAGMDWLAQNADRIADPRQVLPAGRSMLVVGLGHARPAFELADGARVARYAAGRDYHNLMGKRLRKLAERLRREGLVTETRGIVDAGPVLERSHAEEAGLGFASKAANLLHPTFGPWFFLAEILLDADLPPDQGGPPAGSCGTCTACLDTCPTGAIVEPGAVDARLCISYWTIEHRGPVPKAIRPRIDDWAFGCDVCSEVCPWGHKAPDLADRFGVHPALAEGRLTDWLGNRDEAEHAQRLQGSPVRRPRREGLARNAALVLGNRPRAGGGEALEAALREDPSETVRGAAAWALGRGYGSELRVRAALEHARAGDPSEEVRREAREALAGPDEED